MCWVTSTGKDGHCHQFSFRGQALRFLAPMFFASQPGEIIVDTGDIIIRFPLERPAQVMNPVFVLIRKSKVQIPDDPGHGFHAIPASDSRGIRPGIEEGGDALNHLVEEPFCFAIQQKGESCQGRGYLCVK